MHATDTIAAIATPPGAGGIAVIRVSGPRALAIADAVFRGKGLPPSRRRGFSVCAGRVEREGEILDQVLLLVFRAPGSYTGEDAIELQGHGGPVVTRRILQAVVDAGARLAEPGEFTRRAFLNGRMDLLQAEAVADMIHARSERAAQQAAEQLSGVLSDRIEKLYASGVAVASNLEASLDFADDELPTGVLDGVLWDLERLVIECNKSMESSLEGSILREGALIVIIGKPNVGKSTLLNALLNRNRAIVSPIPGTTRDTLEEGLVVSGYPIRLVDTAGLRAVDCPVEQMGIERARDHLARADVTLFVFDASQPLESSEREELERLDPSRTIVLGNKTDLGREGLHAAPAGIDVVPLCLKTGEGLDEIRDRIRARLEALFPHGEEHQVSISLRHRKAMEAFRESVEDVVRVLKAGHEPDLSIAADTLRRGLDELGTLTGRIYHEELLNQIFSRFCIGK